MALRAATVHENSIFVLNYKGVKIELSQVGRSISSFAESTRTHANTIYPILKIVLIKYVRTHTNFPWRYWLEKLPKYGKTFQHLSGCSGVPPWF